MNIDMQKLQAFLLTVECGSITKAAEQMNYTQPGVSRMIREMEHDWGVSLLNRDSSGVRLTSNGSALLHVIQMAYNGCLELKTQLDDMNGLKTGLLRIGSFVSGAITWLPSIMRRFQSDYPNIQFEIKIGSYTEIEQMIMDGQLDGAFLPIPPINKLESIPLGKDRFLVVMPEEHPLSSYEKIPAKALEDYPFLMIQNGNDSEVNDYFKQLQLHVPVRYTLWDDFITMAMVEKGIGISILSSSILQRTPFHLECRELEIPLSRELGLVLESRKNCSIAMRRFIDYLDYRNDYPS